MKPSHYDWMYLAGLFDGEGCILTLPPRNLLTIRIGMTNREVLKWAEERFGGSVYEEKRKEGLKRLWRWTCGAHEGARILKRIRKHLKVKQQEAEIALEIYELSHPKGQYRAIRTPEVVEKVRALAEDLKRSR